MTYQVVCAFPWKDGMVNPGDPLPVDLPPNIIPKLVAIKKLVKAPVKQKPKDDAG